MTRLFTLVFVLVAATVSAGPITISGTDPITFTDGRAVGDVANGHLYYQSFWGGFYLEVWYAPGTELRPTNEYQVALLNSTVIGNIHTVYAPLPTAGGCSAQTDLYFLGEATPALAMLFSLPPANCTPPDPPCVICDPPPCPDCDSTPVPEPATLLMLGMGLTGIAARVRRR